MVTRLLSVLMILALMIHLAFLLSYTANAQEQRPQGSSENTQLQPYSLYNTLYTDLSIRATIAAFIPGRGIAAVSGLDNTSGGYSLEVLGINRSSLSIYRSKYALSGAPTAMVSDGDYGGYIAVGTERGDVVVYSAQDRRVSYVQASRYPVKRLSIGVGASGDPYLAVLDSQGYLYLYRAVRGGWAEIGPRESTAVYNYTKARVLDISGTEVTVDGQRKVDPSLLLILYEPVSVGVTFHIYNETGQPVISAVITARLSRPSIKFELIYQATSDQNGTATLHLPLIDPGGTIYNVSITHPDYETFNMSVELKIESSLEYYVVMKRGQGSVTPIVKSPRIIYAALLDASGVPETIRFGKHLLLTIDPIYVRLIKPSVRGTPWSYIGVIVGYIGDQVVAAFTYFDQNLDPVLVGGREYVWYILPGTPERVWIGYDDDGQGVSVILGSGKIYYFLYSSARGFHLAFWGVDIPRSIVSADYRNSVLVVLDDSGRLHISGANPTRSFECTRGSDYFGVYVGSGIGVWIGSSAGYLSTSSKIYVMNALQSIALSRCSIELVRIYPRVLIQGILSQSPLGIESGYIDIYEGDSLVARGSIVNGSSELYLPRGSYTARVLSSLVNYTRSFDVEGNDIDLLGPTLYRINISLYYYNPESPYTATLSRVPPGLVLSIDNRINITTSGDSVGILLEGGAHIARLVSGDIELARADFSVDRSGVLSLVLRINTGIIRIGLEALGVGIESIPENAVSIRLIAEGPLLRGDLGIISPSSPVIVPLGVYRIIASSPFFYDQEILVGVSRPNSTEDIKMSLIPREIQVRLLVIDELGSPVPNASVSIKERASGASIFSGVTSEDGVVIIPRVLLGDYLVSVEPLNRSLYTGYSGILRIDRQDLVLSLNRTRWNVTLALIDPISGKIISPVRVSIYMSDKLISSINVSNVSLISNISLPYGQVRIIVEQAGQAAIYNKLDISATIPVGGGRVEITLTRRILDITLRIINDLGQPIRGANLVIMSSENPAIELIQETDDEGKATLRLPYGSYEVIASAPGYNKLETQLPAGEQSITIRLQPTLLNLLSRYTVAYIAIGMVVAIIIVARMARRYIERKAREEAV